MWNRVKRWIIPVAGAVLMLALAAMILWVFWDLTAATDAVPTVPASIVEALDLSIPDREYDGRPVYQPDFYFANGRGGPYCPVWVVEIKGKIYLVVCDGVRVYSLEEPWRPSLSPSR